MKTTIFFEDGYATLGIKAKLDFYTLLKKDENNELDAVMIIDESLIEVFKKMETSIFGYTPQFQEKLIELCQKQIGKNIFIVDDWVVSEYQKNQYYHFVKLLNEGYTINQAKLINRRHFEKETQAKKEVQES